MANRLRGHGGFGLIAQAVLGGGESFPLNKFQGAGGDVGLWSLNGTDYTLLERIAGGRYFCVPITSYTATAPLGSATLHQIDTPYFGWLMALEDDKANARLTLTGTGWATFTDANMFGGDTQRSGDAGAYATFTTPAGTTRVGIMAWNDTVNGLSKVEIDGDATLATLLPTAQDVVTAGTFPDTILVANGGSLNPTDRVLDQFFAGHAYKTRTLFATDLAAGVHTIKMTVTGYKRAAASNARLYIDGLLFGGDDTVPTATGFQTVESIQAVASSRPVWEYALSWRPVSGPTYTDFLGNGHGWEFQASIAATADGAEATLAAFKTTPGSSIAITRTSALKHPDIDGGASAIANVTTTYTMKPKTGLDVDISLAWLVDGGQLGASYVGMLSVLESAFDKGANISLPDVVLDQSDGSTNCSAKTSPAYVWKSSGTANYGVLFHCKNLTEATNNWAKTSTRHLWIEDTAGGLLNKIYLTRCETAATPEAVAAGSTIVAHNNYRAQYFAAGGNSVLAR
jgi:hypothetical protein